MRGLRGCAEEKNHRGTEGTESGCDLCLRVLCASVVQLSSQKRDSERASQPNVIGTPVAASISFGSEQFESVTAALVYGPHAAAQAPRKTGCKAVILVPFGGGDYHESPRSGQ